jgi:hypothetical protein
MLALPGANVTEGCSTRTVLETGVLSTFAFGACGDDFSAFSIAVEEEGATVGAVVCETVEWVAYLAFR